MSNILFFDLETTGVDVTMDCVCEAAFKLVNADTGEMLDKKEFFVKPPFPIPPEAMGIHNITNEMVSDSPPIEERGPEIAELVNETDYICAHNLPYDYQLLGNQLPEIFTGPNGNTMPIDTLRWIRRMQPTLPNYKLTSLRYRYSLAEGIEGEAHRAMFDVEMCENLHFRLFKQTAMPMEELPDFIASPMEIAVFGFGKHRGGCVEEVMTSDRVYQVAP